MNEIALKGNVLSYSVVGYSSVNLHMQAASLIVRDFKFTNSANNFAFASELIKI